MNSNFRRQFLAQVVVLTSLTTSLALPFSAFAQVDNYPSKPITLVVPNP
ncbi:MAG: hypothetical protein RL420_1351, partial [Pseudomonadota bacterium]